MHENLFLRNTATPTHGELISVMAIHFTGSNKGEMTKQSTGKFT
jgi:hypothetical protein